MQTANQCHSQETVELYNKNKLYDSHISYIPLSDFTTLITIKGKVIDKRAGERGFQWQTTDGNRAHWSKLRQDVRWGGRRISYGIHSGRFGKRGELVVNENLAGTCTAMETH